MATCIVIIGAWMFLLSPTAGRELRADSGTPATQTSTVSKREFNERYRRWQKYVEDRFAERARAGDPELLRSDRLPKESVFENQPYRDMVALGVGALPHMISRIDEDVSLSAAIIAITQWHYRVVRKGDRQQDWVWYVEDLPEISSQSGPPPVARVCKHWWETGRRRTPELFGKLYTEWTEKKAAGDEAGAKDRYQRMIDLGIVALPCMLGKVQAGDKEMIPAIAALSNKAVTKDATPEAVQAWWAEKKGELRVLLEPETTEQGRSMKADNVATVAISEMYFRPGKADEAKWVELHNYGDRAVSIAGWTIADGQGHVFVVPGGLEKVPPKGYVLVTFGGAAGEADRLNFDGGKAAKVFCREGWVGEVFSGYRNECAVYSSAKPDADTLVDYVCWGLKPTTTSEHQERAIASGRWPDRKGLRLAVPDLRMGDTCDLPIGGSLFRMLSDSAPLPGGGWLTCGPEDITPGQPNRWPAPIPLMPDSGGHLLGGGQIPQCRCMVRANPPGRREDLRYQIQVARDAGFDAVVLDKTVDGEARVLFDLPVGNYFWRVRCLYRETETSPQQTTGWSRVVDFRLVSFQGVP